MDADDGLRGRFERWVPVLLALFFIWRTIDALTPANPDHWAVLANLAMSAAMVRVVVPRLLQLRADRKTARR
jgi:hypothetical protein